MPSLDFKGKPLVYSHHLSVPARALAVDAKKSLPPKGGKPALDDNLIIHGDNLHALKALLPRYAGKVNCIYIDPPYNTGNEGWAYNDNVNSPLMQAWLKNKGPVDGEDLERHDKWLCMMWPRLQLLHELLADDGVIFISIDDNEQHHLRLIMDEIFGEQNFIQNIIWQKKYSPQNDAKYFSDMHDFVICYAKNKIQGDVKDGWKRNLLARSDEMDGRYKNPDNDPRGVWKPSDFSVKTYSEEYDYAVTTPSGRVVNPPQGRSWRTSKDNYETLIKENRVFFGKRGDAVPQIKRFLSEVKQGVVPLSIWRYKDVGHNQDARKELKELFADAEFPFETPKPVSLIKRILEIATNKNSLILDSFAGSGTTAQAVLELNQQDGGRRRFILVECEANIADTITAERVRRIIKGVPEAKEARLKKGLGGSFTYCTLGAEINAENMLHGKNLPSYDTLAQHLFFTATGTSPDKLRPKTRRGKDGFFYETAARRFYLIYEPNLRFLRANDSALNSERAERIAKELKQANKTALVFATHKFMGQKELTAMGITFCGLAYGVE